MKNASRRVAAVVLFDLPFQILARFANETEPDAPLAVVYRDEGEVPELAGASCVDAVNASARERGARVGMRVSEVTAVSAKLRVVHLTRSAVGSALSSVCEVAMGLGSTVEIAPSGDTIWIDTTGIAHLFGGEEALLVELEERVLALGFRSSLAMADGPRIAEALARFDRSGSRVAEVGGARVLEGLPLQALFQSEPTTAELSTTFGRLGVLTVGDFLELPKAQLSSRLGRHARDLLALAGGRDARQLVPFVLPENITETAEFEDGVDTAPQLVFVAKHMASRFGARLDARGQASNRIDITLSYDRTVLACLLGAAHARETVDNAVSIAIDLPAPLHREADLFRTLKAKLENLTLAAPCRSFSVTLSRIVDIPKIQLDLSRDVSVSPDALPALLSELAAEIGIERLGVLRTESSHCPEERSRLVEVNDVHEHVVPSVELLIAPEPTRLLPVPVPLGDVWPPRERLLFAGSDAFDVATASFDRRLGPLSWWTERPKLRDYYRVLFSFDDRDPRRSESQRLFAAGTTKLPAVCEGWVYVDREAREAFLHGYWE